MTCSDSTGSRRTAYSSPALDLGPHRLRAGAPRVASPAVGVRRDKEQPSGDEGSVGGVIGGRRPGRASVTSIRTTRLGSRSSARRKSLPGSRPWVTALVAISPGGMGRLGAVWDAPGRQLLRHEVACEACSASAAGAKGEVQYTHGRFVNGFGGLHRSLLGVPPDPVLKAPRAVCQPVPRPNCSRSNASWSRTVRPSGSVSKTCTPS